MPIILSLTGRAPLTPDRLTRSEARDWLASAAVWFEGLGDTVLDARVVRDAEEKPVLLVAIHPASPPVEVRLGASGRVRVHAVTSPAGPGYHIHLCERFRQFAADFDLTWDDEATNDPTTFFTTNDRPACERHFLRWLGAACGKAIARGPDDIAYVGISPNQGFTAPGPVQTPLGSRSREWLAEVAATPDAPVARDFFPWWNPELDSAFYRNRALTRLWCEFPWRPPLTEEEGELTDQIANDLASAYKLDPAGELPWREWLELLSAIENDEDGHTVSPADPSLTEAVTQRAWEADPAEPRIGYRRFPVRATLTGGWSLEVPGDFAREWGDERTWTGWNAARTIWFHPVSYTKPDGSKPTPAEVVAVGRRSLPEGESIAWRGDGLRGEAVFGETEEDGRRVWRLSGVTAAEGQLVVCHVYSDDPDDRDWAVTTWHSLRQAG